MCPRPPAASSPTLPRLLPRLLAPTRVLAARCSQCKACNVCAPVAPPVCETKACCLSELSPAPTSATRRTCSAGVCAGPCSSCERDGCCVSGAPGRRTSAVVFQTHVVTTSVVARLVLARRQLAARGMRMFVTFLAGEGEVDTCPSPGAPASAHPGLAELRAALDPERVWCLDARDYAAIWPNFFTTTVEGLARDHRSRYRL